MNDAQLDQAAHLIEDLALEVERLRSDLSRLSGTQAAQAKTDYRKHLTAAKKAIEALENGIQ